MKRHSKQSADEEAIAQALEQLQHSVDIIQQIVHRIQRSMLPSGLESEHNQNTGTAQNTQAPRQSERRYLDADDLKQKDPRFQHRGNRRQHDHGDKSKQELSTEDLPKVLH